MTGLRSTRSVGGAFLVWLAAITAGSNASGQGTIEIPLGELDPHELQRQIEASRLSGEELEHFTNTLLDAAARGAIGQIPTDRTLTLTFTVRPDTAGLEQVQQHALTFTYTPADRWVRTQLQRQNGSEWEPLLDGYGADGRLFVSYGVHATTEPVEWRFVIQERNQDAELTYNVTLVREHSLLGGPASQSDVTVSDVRQFKQSSAFYRIEGTVSNNASTPLTGLARVRSYVYDAQGNLLAEDSDTLGSTTRQGANATFSILVASRDVAGASRFELKVFNRVSSTDVELSCGGCESRPWQSDGGGTNRAPQASGSIPSQRLTAGASSTRVNVARYFTDPDGDTLTYSARSSALSVVSASTSGSTVTLSPSGSGSATVAVTAQDPGGLTATQRISVTVSGGGGGSACRVGQLLNPGDYCTVDIPGVNVGTNRFEVRSDGRGCFGNICSSGNVNLSGFRASRVSGTSQWRIDALP